MGLTHAMGASGINRGYQFVKSVMGGNAIPYYSTPNRFDPAYGIVNTIDGVKYMNGNSEAVSNFRLGAGPANAHVPTLRRRARPGGASHPSPPRAAPRG